MKPQLRIAFAVSMVLAGLVATVPARAADTEPVSVRVNMARVLRIASPAATVIIGNPAVADVTIQDPQTLVLTGKTYGQTNLIVLDASGNPVADTMIEVIQEQADLVTVFNGTSRTTFSCVTNCGPALSIGDDPDFTDEVVQSLQKVQSAQ